MNINTPSLLVKLSTLIICLLGSQLSIAGVWYRTTKANGQPLVSTTLSQQHIDNGYQVLNAQMMVIRTVPAYNEKDIQKAQQQEVLRAKRHAEDTDFIRRYGSSGQADKLYQNTISELKARQNQINIDLERITNNLINDLKKAAPLEQKGLTIPQSLKEQIDAHHNNIKILKANLAMTNEQITEQDKIFNQAIARLREIERQY